MATIGSPLVKFAIIRAILFSKYTINLQMSNENRKMKAKDMPICGEFSGLMHGGDRLFGVHPRTFGKTVSFT
jgi:hypothetical protein